MVADGGMEIEPETRRPKKKKTKKKTDKMMMMMMIWNYIFSCPYLYRIEEKKHPWRHFQI